MNNLINALISEYNNNESKFITDLNKETTIKGIKDSWIYNQLLTPATMKKEWVRVVDLINYLIKRYKKKNDSILAKKIKSINYISQAEDIEKITINVEWKRSRTWGSNPTAESRNDDFNHNRKHYTSGSIGGCGYDKHSTAIAKVLNQSNGLLKAMYKLKNNNMDKSNHDLFGYGSGYGLLPYIEGGVGVSCYPDIMESIGFNFENISSGKSFDVHQITTKKD